MSEQGRALDYELEGPKGTYELNDLSADNVLDLVDRLRQRILDLPGNKQLIVSRDQYDVVSNHVDLADETGRADHL